MAKSNSGIGKAAAPSGNDIRPDNRLNAVGNSVQRGFEQGAYQSLLDVAGYPPAGAVPPRNQAAPKPAPAPAPEGGAPAAEESAAPSGGPYAPR